MNADPYKESAVEKVKRDIPRVGEEGSEFNEWNYVAQIAHLKQHPDQRPTTSQQ